MQRVGEKERNTELKMPRNPVQFQKGMSDADFDRLYGAEDHCRNLRKPEIEN